MQFSLLSMIVFTLANSADPDEMRHFAAFYLGLHSFGEVPFQGLLVMGIGWIFIIDHWFKVNERLSIIIG